MRGSQRVLCLAGWLMILIMAGVAFPVPEGAPESPLAGYWTGKIQLPGMELAIEVNLVLQSDGAWQGTISIPQQGAKDLPLEISTLTPEGVRFKIGGVPGSPEFNGALASDSRRIEGSFTQGGHTVPFILEQGVDPVAAARSALRGFDEAVVAAMKSFNVPGVAIAVVKGDQLVLARGYGFRDVDAGQPVTADTLFAIGSASKAFTSFTLGTLADAGKMEWDRPLRHYIPWFRLHDDSAGERLTPRDLVTHRSGLPRHDLVWYNNHHVSREELVHRLAYLRCNADLRERWQYNNLMFLTAGYLVETLTGQTWEASVRQRVLDPLEMRRTNFSVLDSQKDADYAQPYRDDSGKPERMPFRVITTMGPAGSINSSVNEMSHWVMVHLNQGVYGDKKIINPATLTDMHLSHMSMGETPGRPDISPASYGMGWFLDTYRGHQRVYHGGNIDGFSALVSLLPQDGIGFVVLTNLNATGLPEMLVRHATDRLLDLDPVPWLEQAAKRKTKGDEQAREARQKSHTLRRSGTTPAHALDEYAGEYEHPGYGMLTVRVVDGTLQTIFNDISTPLEHWHYETFNGLKSSDDTFENMKYTFVTDVQGDVAAVRAPFEPAVDEIEFRRCPDARMSDPAYLSALAGRYMLTGQTVTVSLKGDTLTVMVPGQPVYSLVPGLGGRFSLKEFPLITVRFVTDDEGRITALEFNQPNGVFTAQRKK